MNNEKNVTLVYDARCRMCSAGASWLHAHAGREKIRFLPLQTEAGSELLKRSGLNHHDPQTILVVVGKTILTNSSAVLYLLEVGGGLWWLLAMLLDSLPKKWLDAAYTWMAMRRYRWFRRMDDCMIIDPRP